MRFTVGGEKYDFSREQVVRRMKGVRSEPIQKHTVDIEGTIFPPKQVFAELSGRARTSFTTMEAQRVLRRLGFDSHQPGRRAAPAEGAPSGAEAKASSPERVADVEARLATIEAAVAGLHARVNALESVG